MGGANPNDPPALALDIGYAQVVNEDSTVEYDFNQVAYLNPVKWAEWITLPIREYDQVIRSSRLTIRVPTVIIAPKYNKVPLKKMTLSGRNLYERDGGICAYSGKKLKREDASIDHVIPRSRGGSDSWENVVLADKKINNNKGNKMNDEAGLKLLHQPFQPEPVSVAATLKEIRHRDWAIFLNKK